MNLTVANTPVRQDADGRICLNDLHRAAGGEKRHQPNEWRRLQQTQELVAELEGPPGIPGGPVNTVNDGRNNGTYACRDLAYAYAMWISPAFFLKVVRVYDAVANSMAGLLPVDSQTPDHYESEYERLQAELERLEATPIVIMPAQYREMREPNVLIGPHHVRVVDMIAMTEAHGVPRKAVEEMLGINNNTMRQHALRGRRSA